MEWKISEYLASLGRSDDREAEKLLRGFVNHFWAGLSPIGFMETLSGGATVTLVARPQCMFLPCVLVVPVGDDFAIENIMVGMNSVLLTPGPLPASVFLEIPSRTGGRDMRFLNLKTPLTCHPYMDLSIRARNLCAYPRSFEAVIWGLENPPSSRKDDEMPVLKPGEIGRPQKCYGCGKDVHVDLLSFLCTSCTLL